MLTIKYETSFKKDYKRIIKRGYDPALFEAVVTLLANEEPLPPKYHDHPLSGIISAIVHVILPLTGF